MEVSYKSIQAIQKVITGDSLENGHPIGPYRSGPELVEFFNELAENDEYGQGFPSRWSYVEEKLTKYNGSDNLRYAIESAFDPRNFMGSDFQVEKAADYVNSYLEYDEFKVSKDGKFYRVFRLDEKVEENQGEVSEKVNVMESEEDGVIIFISHSSKDVEIAEQLVNLLRTALNLSSKQIRCTSVDGYRLPGGSSTNDQLKEEIYNSKSFIGLITPNSLESSYVLFELGARWGAKRQLIPILAGGAEASDLVGPLTGLNALSCHNTSQMFQLVNELRSFLDVDTEKVEVYSKKIDELVIVSNT